MYILRFGATYTRAFTVFWFPEYENEAQVGENFIDCDDGRQPDSLNKVCRFKVDYLGDFCTWQRDYGYDEGQPCVLFKLNKVSLAW